MDPEFAIEVRIHFFSPEDVDIEGIVNDIVVAPVNL